VEVQRGRVGSAVIAAQWGRIGCVGFGALPTHIALLRAVCVQKPALAARRDVVTTLVGAAAIGILLAR
jgi:hypothetical protein